MDPKRASCLLLPLFALSLAAQPPASDLDHKLTEKIATALRASGAPSVSVAVVENGRTAYLKAFGKADIAANRDSTPTTRYAIGSISKQFTAVALLLLQEQGKVSLDDKVAKYYPDLTQANAITVRQLLSHTAGYEDYAPQDYIIPEWTKPTNAQEIVNHWAKKPLNFDPGTRWQYSNTGYVLAAMIFEKASGRQLVDYLREKVFTPLSMTSAGDCGDRVPEDATAYTRYALGPPRPVQREAKGWYLGAGELCMTPADLAKWDVAFLQKKILSGASYDELTREVLLKNGDHTHYALGLSLGEMRGVPLDAHSGEVSGFLASNFVYPTRNAAVVVLSNQDGIDLIGPISRQISEVLLQPAEQPALTQKNTDEVKGILAGLQKGEINRGLFTSNANSYFSDTAIQDIKNSLANLGTLKSVTQANEQLRGGMIHRSYRAEFEKKAVRLNIYVLPDGKYEQFMVEEQI